MTISDIRNHLENLVGHVTFDYNGYSCGIDPLAIDKFEMWCGDNMTTLTSVEDVMDVKFFDGGSLADIWDDITDLDY